MPDSNTVIVLGHHITTAEEWIWREDSNGRYYCAANDHMSSVIDSILSDLSGEKNKIVSYPHESGLQFRFVGEAAGLGKICNSAYLLHPVWGPWMHLRVLGTTKVIDWITTKINEEFCEDCDKCYQVCPANAFENGFDGLKCRQYRKSMGDYTPYGPENIHIGCKKCAIVCQMGKRPTGRFPKFNR